jgi:hypothetical protein
MRVVTERRNDRAKSRISVLPPRTYVESLDCISYPKLLPGCDSEIPACHKTLDLYNVSMSPYDDGERRTSELSLRSKLSRMQKRNPDWPQCGYDTSS